MGVCCVDVKMFDLYDSVTTKTLRSLIPSESCKQAPFVVVCCFKCYCYTRMRSPGDGPIKEPLECDNKDYEIGLSK